MADDEQHIGVTVPTLEAGHHVESTKPKAGGGLFARVPLAAIVDPTLNDGDVRVLGGICAYMRSDNWAWPSQSLLAFATGRSRSAANRSIQKLAKHGHIDVHRVRHRDGSMRCSYEVHFRSCPKTWCS